MQVSRLILIGAALVATASIGVVTLRPTKTAPADNAQASADAEIDAMIGEIEAKLKTRPNDPEGWRVLGQALYQAQRYAQSAVAYRRAAVLAPTDAETWSSVGETLVLSSAGGFPAEAKAAFTTALTRDPKNVRARYFLNVEKDIAGDHRGALDGWIALLRDSRADAPWQGEVRALIAQVSAEHKIDVSAQMATLPAGPSPVPGASDEQSAVIRSMVDGLAKKLEADPKNVDGWIMLMRSQMALGRPAEAQASLKSARAANPADTDKLDQAAAELRVR